MSEEPTTIRIVIAGDQRVVRSGLRLLLEAEPGFEVVAEAGDIQRTRRTVLGHKPDVLILEVTVPGERSLPAIPALLEASPTTRIVVLTMQEDPAFAREALRSGATGCVLTEAADAELVQAVHMAARGRTYLPPELGAPVAAEPPRPDDLTKREAQILGLIALGHTNNEIGQQLYLSVRTVESHRAHIQQKLGRSTRAELVRYALENGLVDFGRGKP